MSSNESYLASRAEDLEAPVPLARPAPDLYANFEYNPDRDKLSADDYLEGEVVLAFTVNDRGRTEDLRIVKADPENFTEMEARLRNAVKEFAYRPRLADGKAIATPDMQHRFRYFYTPTEYQASLDKAARPRSPWQSRKP
jgi:protein TonB